MTARVNGDTRTARALPTPVSPPAPSHLDEPAPAPVFVDVTGRRRRLIRRAALTLLGIVCAYGVAIVVSFLGGPVPPNALLPLPGVPSAPSGTTSTGKPNAPTPAVSGHAAPAGSGNAGTTPSAVPTTGTSHSRGPSQSASPSPTSDRHVPPGHTTKSASPGPTNGHGH